MRPPSRIKEAELSLAKRLIDELTEKKFAPAKYRDNHRDRVVAAAQQKVAGQQVSEVAAEPRRGQVIDLMATLKASLEKRGVAARTADRAKEETAARGAEARTEADARTPHLVVQRQRAGSKK